MSDIQKQSGVISAITPMEKGTSKKGEWTKQIYVLGVEITKKDGGTFTKNLALEAFNKQFDVKVGQTVEAVFSASSNEYNGRWYTNLNLLEFSNVQGATPSNTAMPQAQGNDDLPF